MMITARASATKTRTMFRLVESQPSTWVKFPTTAEELKKVFERIWIGAKDDFGQTYAEWFNTDYDCYVDGLYDLLGEYANLDELNYLASKLDDMS